MTLRKTIWATVVLLWAVNLAMAQQSLPQAPHMGTIIGTVVDVNGGTVPGATVVLQGPSQNDHRAITTGDDGFFRFDGIEPGTLHCIVVTASGLTNWTSKDISLQPGQLMEVSGIRLGIPPLVESVNATTMEELAAQQVKAAEKQRVFGVVPNFYVSYEQNAAPLTPRLKFQLAMKALTDPVTIASFGVNAAILQAAGYPSYGQGAQAYGKRLGATFAGGYTRIIVGDALLASALHQDPRYFYQGTGTTRSRLMHALSSAFVTRGDDGSREINWSNFGGDLAAGALSYAYFPSQDRGPGLLARSALIATGGRVGLAVLQEFVLHKVTSRPSSEDH